MDRRRPAPALLAGGGALQFPSVIPLAVPRSLGFPLYFFCAASNLFTASNKAFVCAVCENGSAKVCHGIRKFSEWNLRGIRDAFGP